MSGDMRKPARWGRRTIRRLTPPIASVQALADYHHVSPATVRRWIAQGRLPGSFRTAEGWWIPRRHPLPPDDHQKGSS